MIRRHRAKRCTYTRAANTPALSFVHVSKRFPQASGLLEVLRDVSLDVPASEIVAIVGPSGSGKSTLLSFIELMDEPFSRLDAQTRATMHGELLRIHAERAVSILFVTHDVEEAVVLASRIIVISPQPGRVHRALDVPLDHPRLDAAPTQALVGILRSAIANME